MGRLEGKTALITGGGGGIGSAIAERFHDEGASVIVNDLRSEAAEKTAGRLGGRAVTADVADSRAVAEMFASIDGRLDILVNNAGISGMEGRPEDSQRRQELSMQQAAEIQAGGPIETFVDVTVDMTDEDWRRMLDVHLTGTFYCTREALKIMNRQGSGTIINMGSIMGTAGGGGSPHYCAAKAGILGFTRSLARELAARRIRVNAIAPGWIDTDMTRHSAQKREGFVERVVARTPQARWGKPEDFQGVAVFLASRASDFITGSAIVVDGGFSSLG